MDKFEKFLRSEMSVRRLASWKRVSLSLVPILQKPPCQPTDRPFGRQTRQRLVHGISPPRPKKSFRLKTAPLRCNKCGFSAWHQCLLQ